MTDTDGPATGSADCFDLAVRAYLRRHPLATVVALGEGLGTGFWRLDNGSLEWLTVELPEAAAMRRILMPDGPRRRTIACPAAGTDWPSAVRAPEHGVVVVARGLLMFLPPPGVRALLAVCAERFPGGALVFDTVPRRCAGRAGPRGGAATERDAPPLLWGMDAADRPKLASAHPNIVAVREVPPPDRGPLAGRLARWRGRVPLLRSAAPAVTEIRFGRPGSAPADPERAAGRRSR
ncbi:class I SAM-dependent methyltransferase [Streptomyces sp. NPDC017056]|uniref:class I SAM-dependent methyltransferase n=1 Tax=Streptomyces sp. NPDC017056 TaxID=3364973 RepID=UPI003790A0B6